MVVFPVKTKAAVPDVLRDAIRWLRQQSGNRHDVHVVASDRGGEYVFAKLRWWCAKHGYTQA
jgi:hypothetical protein